MLGLRPWLPSIVMQRSFLREDFAALTRRITPWIRKADDASTRPGYFSNRWHARVPLSTLFWRDILAFATVINLFAGFLSLMSIAQDWGKGWSLSLHFALLPYNLFLVASVWRFPAAPPLIRWISLGWFALILML